MTLRLASLNQILDPWIYILFRKELFSNFVKLTRNIVSRFCKSVARRSSTASRVKNGISSANDSTFARETTSNVDSLANNYDENDVFLSELSATTTSKQSISSYKKRNSSKTERPSLQELLSQHNPHCFGLKHPACLFCFSNLPHEFAIALSIGQTFTNAHMKLEECDQSNEAR